MKRAVSILLLMALALFALTSCHGRKDPSQMFETPEEFDLSQKQAMTGIAFLGIERLPEGERPKRELLLRWYMATERIKEENKTIVVLFPDTGLRYFSSDLF